MRVFYAVRFFLGLLSVTTDTVLVVALSRKYGKRLATYALAMMCLTSGCFFASTSKWSMISCHHLLLPLCYLPLRVNKGWPSAIYFMILHSVGLGFANVLLYQTLMIYRFLAEFVFYVCNISCIRFISSG